MMMKIYEMALFSSYCSIVSVLLPVSLYGVDFAASIFVVVRYSISWLMCQTRVEA